MKKLDLKFQKNLTPKNEKIILTLTSIYFLSKRSICGFIKTEIELDFKIYQL